MQDNSEQPRIVIPKDNLARTRLIEVQKQINEIQSTHPEVLGLTVFGSSVSGRMHEASDIDGYLFIDVDNLPENSFSNKIERGSFDIDRRRVRLSEEYVSHYKHLIGDPLQDSLNLTPLQVEHLRPLPISHQIIDVLVSDYVEYHHRIDAYNQREQEIIECLDRQEFDFPPSLPWPNEPFNEILYGLFHMTIGHGLEPYRNQVFETLGNLGEKGELIWSEIIEHTIGMETKMGNDPRTNGIKFPKTLSSAKSAYQH